MPEDQCMIRIVCRCICVIHEHTYCLFKFVHLWGNISVISQPWLLHGNVYISKTSSLHQMNRNCSKIGSSDLLVTVLGLGTWSLTATTKWFNMASFTRTSTQEYFLRKQLPNDTIKNSWRSTRKGGRVGGWINCTKKRFKPTRYHYLPIT